MKDYRNSNITVGIDASNIRLGGGITHIVELINSYTPLKDGVTKIIIWGPKECLKNIEAKDFVKKISPSILSKSLIKRLFWQCFILSSELKKENVSILFVPGGSYSVKFKPVVVLCQNMLPFEWKELIRFKFSILTLKFLVLRFTQGKSFKNANGMIFLNEYAKNRIQKEIGLPKGLVKIIPHGINKKFTNKKLFVKDIDTYSEKSPFRILYVSNILPYKHQWNVIKAIAKVRFEENWPLVLDLVGSIMHKASGKLFIECLNKYDPKDEWINYHKYVDHQILDTFYKNADLGVFASTCENLPIILLEYMGSGVPLICSNFGPMPNTSKNSLLYFNPEQPADIEKQLKKMIRSPELRYKCAKAAMISEKDYSWTQCSTNTFEFIKDVYKKYKYK